MPLTPEQMSFIFISWLVVTIGREFITWKTRKALKRADIKHVTEAECKQCREDCKAAREVKDTALIALITELQAEVKRGNTAVEALHLDILKHMLHGDVPNEVIEGMLERYVGLGGTT